MSQSENKRKKIIKVSLLAVVAVVVLALGGWFAWKQTSPALPQTVEDIEKLFDDSRYQTMGRAQQQPYLERVNELWGGMNEDDRRRLGALLESNPEAQAEAMDAMAQAMRDTYANSVRSGNMAFIDGMADQAGNEMAQNMGDLSDIDPEEMEEARQRMNQFLDSGDPQAMGFMSEVMKGMMDRRRERGQGGL